MGAMYLSYTADCSEYNYQAGYAAGYEDGYEGVTPEPSPTPTIVTWAEGTDEEIVAMVEAADAGELDLTEYWAVGNERSVHLDPIKASDTNSYGKWTVGESHVEQYVTMVLMDTNRYELVTSVLDKNKQERKNCSFVVGQKNCLANGTTLEGGYMNSTATSSGSWDGSARRKWCNAAYPAALPANLVPAFKRFKVDTIKTYNGSTVQTSEDLFALFAEKEIFGTRTYSKSKEASSLTQIEYYKTSSNRIKKAGDAGSSSTWWERSPAYSANGSFCVFLAGGSANCYNANRTYGVAPFGCI